MAEQTDLIAAAGGALAAAFAGLAALWRQAARDTGAGRDACADCVARLDRLAARLAALDADAAREERQRERDAETLQAIAQGVRVLLDRRG